MPRIQSGQIAARLAWGAPLFAGLLMAAAPPPVLARPATSCRVGVAHLDFRDVRLADLYGAPLAPDAELHVALGGRFSLSLAASYAWRTNEADAMAFVTEGETAMRIAPLRLHLCASQGLFRSWSFAAGPLIGWTWFREEWRAAAPDLGLDARHHATGGWLTLGAKAELRAELGSAGSLSAACEWSWADADRKAVPGNEYQTAEMAGGWRILCLTWEPPWLRSEPRAPRDGWGNSP